jgi:hypothetical protein
MSNTPYRIFISYSHSDEEEVKSLSEILEDNKLCPIRDSEFSSGYGFHEQIKKFIAHAYVFMPVISKSSKQKGWVHQEIGFAMAHNIPVLPIVIDKDSLPEDMINELQAIKALPSRDRESLKEKLSWEKIDNLIKTSAIDARPTYECAYYHQNRTMMLVEYASETIKLLNKQPKLFRQSGGLSSLHIPSTFIGHKDWYDRNPLDNRLDFNNHWLRKEKIIFEKIAKEYGFKIIVNLDLKFDDLEGIKNIQETALNIRKARLEHLVSFLTSIPDPADNKYELVNHNPKDPGRNVIIVGDLFMAESLTGKQGKGFKQTIFTRHALTIREQIELFDSEFNELKNKMGGDSSVKYALAEIDKRLKKINDIQKGKSPAV